MKLNFITKIFLICLLFVTNVFGQTNRSVTMDAHSGRLVGMSTNLFKNNYDLLSQVISGANLVSQDSNLMIITTTSSNSLFTILPEGIVTSNRIFNALGYHPVDSQYAITNLMVGPGFTFAINDGVLYLTNTNPTPYVLPSNVITGAVAGSGISLNQIGGILYITNTGGGATYYAGTNMSLVGTTFNFIEQNGSNIMWVNGAPQLFGSIPYNLLPPKTVTNVIAGPGISIALDEFGNLTITNTGGGATYYAGTNMSLNGTTFNFIRSDGSNIVWSGNSPQIVGPLPYNLLPSGVITGAVAGTGISVGQLGGILYITNTGVGTTYTPGTNLSLNGTTFNFVEVSGSNIMWVSGAPQLFGTLPYNLMPIGTITNVTVGSGLTFGFDSNGNLALTNSNPTPYVLPPNILSNAVGGAGITLGQVGGVLYITNSNPTPYVLPSNVATNVSSGTNIIISVNGLGNYIINTTTNLTSINQITFEDNSIQKTAYSNLYSQISSLFPVTLVTNVAVGSGLSFGLNNGMLTITNTIPQYFLPSNVLSNAIGGAGISLGQVGGILYITNTIPQYFLPSNVLSNAVAGAGISLGQVGGILYITNNNPTPYVLPSNVATNVAAGTNVYVSTDANGNYIVGTTGNVLTNGVGTGNASVVITNGTIYINSSGTGGGVSILVLGGGLGGSINGATLTLTNLGTSPIVPSDNGTNYILQVKNGVLDFSTPGASTNLVQFGLGLNSSGVILAPTNFTATNNIAVTTNANTWTQQQTMNGGIAFSDGSIQSNASAVVVITSVNISTNWLNYTFSNIPSNFTTLMILTTSKCANNATPFVQFQCNGDSSSSYSRRSFWLNGTTLQANTASSSALYGGYSTVSVGNYSTSINAEFRNYSVPNINRLFHSYFIGADTSVGANGNWDGVWINTNVITSITILSSSPDPFLPAKVTLYGIK